MPYAKRRQASELNKAYAFVCEPSFGQAARELADKLVAMGFEEDGAIDNIEPVQRELTGQQDLFEPHEKPTFKYAVPATPETLLTLKNRKNERMTVRETDDGKVEIFVTGPIDSHLEKVIYEAAPEMEHLVVAEAISKYRNLVRARLSPAERGEKLDIPRLMVQIQGKLQFAEADTFMEFHDWSLLDHSAKMSESEFAIRETARSFAIDIDGKRVTYQFAGEAEQLRLDVDIEGWTPEGLVLWLERQVRQIDVHPNELLKWLRHLVGHLIHARKMSVSTLMRCKFTLARKIQDKIVDIRQKERCSVYQRYLFAPEAKVMVSFDNTFSFKEGMYRDQRRYRGRWKPQKHFLGPDRVPAFDGADDGEEVQCAQVIDSLSSVRHWVRNRSASFEFVSATNRHGIVLPGLRGIAGRRSSSGRRVQGCAYRRRIRHRREAGDRRALGAGKRRQGFVPCCGETGRWKGPASSVDEENRRRLRERIGRASACPTRTRAPRPFKRLRQLGFKVEITEMQPDA